MGSLISPTTVQWCLNVDEGKKSPWGFDSNPSKKNVVTGAFQGSQTRQEKK
jgi:hypothetical protein